MTLISRPTIRKRVRSIVRGVGMMNGRCRLYGIYRQQTSYRFCSFAAPANGFSAGLVGNHYDQISGDSGIGARLGDFKGRVAALAETVGCTFKIDRRNISARVKVFRRFDGQNRLEGAAAFITIALPLYGQPPPQQSANPVVARY